MERIIKVNVRDKVATSDGTLYVCGNGDYVVEFNFDAEWDEFEVKTARFVWNRQYHDQVFSGNRCPVPVMIDTHRVLIGVYAGNLECTTPAVCPAQKSILCGGGVPAPPTDDTYAQILEMLGALQVVTDEQIEQDVKEYLEAHSVEDLIAEQAARTEELLAQYVQTAQECEASTKETVQAAQEQMASELQQANRAQSSAANSAANAQANASAAQTANQQAADQARVATEKAQAAQMAAVRQPIIQGRTWWCWSAQVGNYVDTGIRVDIAQGEKGDAGVGVESFEQTVESTESGGKNIVEVTLSDGTVASFSVYNGAKGDKGDSIKGDPGYTPKKGEDYWTPDDKNEIMQEVNASVEDLETDMQTVLREIADLKKFHPIAISNVSNNVGTVELGRSIASVTVTWKLNKSPVSQNVNGTDVDPADRSVVIDGPFTSSKTFTVTATDSEDNTTKGSTSINFYNGVYYGALAVGALPTNEEILALARSLQGGRGVNISWTPVSGKRPSYACPTRYGTPKFTIGPNEYEWKKLGTLSFTNGSGNYTENYDVWQHPQDIAESLTITVS